MLNFFKSKRIIIVLLGIGTILSVIIFYQIKPTFFLQNKHPPELKEKLSSHKSLKPTSLSKIDRKKLPPEARPLLDSLIELENKKTTKNKNLKINIKKADALIANADKVISDNNLLKKFHILKKELSKNESAKKADDLQQRLNLLQKK